MSKFEARPIGTSGLSVAPLALGGNVFGWTADEDVSFTLLDAFVDAGGTMIDSADVYSAWVPGHVGGESETVPATGARTTRAATVRRAESSAARVCTRCADARAATASERGRIRGHRTKLQPPGSSISV